MEGFGGEELEGPDAVGDEVGAELIGEGLELEFRPHAGPDLGSDSEDPIGIGAGEGVGSELVGEDPFGGGGAAADVEVELDGVRVRVRVLGSGRLGVFEVEGFELGVDGVEGGCRRALRYFFFLLRFFFVFFEFGFREDPLATLRTAHDGSRENENWERL